MIRNPIIGEVTIMKNHYLVYRIAFFAMVMLLMLAFTTITGQAPPFSGGDDPL